MSGLTVDRIVREATGRRERDLVCLLPAAGFALVVIQPRPAREFANALGSRATTDRIGAKAWADRAQVGSRPPERDRVVSILPPPEQPTLQALGARQRPRVGMPVAAPQRRATRHAAAGKPR